MSLPIPAPMRAYAPEPEAVDPARRVMRLWRLRSLVEEHLLNPPGLMALHPELHWERTATGRPLPEGVVGQVWFGGPRPIAVATIFDDGFIEARPLNPERSVRPTAALRRAMDQVHAFRAVARLDAALKS